MLSQPDSTEEYPERGRRFLIAAGTWRYDRLSELEQLPADEIQGALQRIVGLFTDMGYMRLLPEICDNPTSGELRDKLGTWFSETGHLTSDDIVVFYYTGHGYTEENLHYLLTSDSKHENLDGTAIPTDLLSRWIAKSRLQHALIIIDTCFAGKGTGNISHILSEIKSVRPMDRDAIQGFFAIAASAPKQEAWPGAFPQALDAVIRNPALHLTGNYQPYHRIESIVAAVNDELKGSLQAQTVLWDATGAKDRSHLIRNLHYIPGNAAPRMIDLLPPARDSTWIERPPYQEVKAALLRHGDGQHACIVSAVHGMGGIGKTWLARALANDPVIRKERGVLWVTVGQETIGSEPIMRDLIALLAPSHPRTETFDGVQSLLRSLLAEKPRLLVLDDVSNEEIAADFVSLFAEDSPSRLLITTRKRWMADNLGVASFPLDLMTEVESLALFERQLGRTLRLEELDPARHLAETVQYLPLALSLVVARIKRGQSWDNVRETLKKNLSNLNDTKPRQPGQKIEFTLEAVFNTSLIPLRDAQEWRPCWEGFLRLSILAEDTQITAKLALRLLGEQGPAILKLLADEALLTRVPGDAHVYQMHDLLQDHARQLLVRNAPDGLATSLPRAETELLACYGLDCSQPETFRNAWRLEEDGYIHHHLMYHLTRLGQLDCMEMVLSATTPDGKNGWFKALETLGQTGDFIADVEQWKCQIRVRSLGQIEGDSILNSLGKEVRSCLLLSTMRSLAANVPPRLLPDLLRFGIWKPTQALVYIKQVGEVEKQAEAITVLAFHLPSDLIQQLLEIGKGIKHELRRSEALAALIPRLSTEQALETTKEITNEPYLSQALVALIPRLPAKQALEIVHGIGEEAYRSKALLALAPHLPSDLLPQALEIAQGIRQEEYRAKALAGLAPYLPSDLMKQALEIVQEIGTQEYQAEALAALAPHMSTDQLQQALEIVQEIGEEVYRTKVLADLAPHLPSDLMKQALEIVQEIGTQEFRAEALAALAPHLPSALLPQALEVVRGIEEWHRAKALAALAPHLPSNLLPQTLIVVQNIRKKAYWSEALAGLAPYLPSDLMKQALEIVQGMGTQEYRSEVLAASPPHLPDLLPQALESVEEKGTEN